MTNLTNGISQEFKDHWPLWIGLIILGGVIVMLAATGVLE